MADDTCSGFNFKPRIAEMKHNSHQDAFTLQQQEGQECSIPVSTVSAQDFKESSGIVFSTTESTDTGVSFFERVRCSYDEDKFEIKNDLREGKKELGFACFVSGVEQNQEKLDSGVLGCDGNGVQGRETVNYEVDCVDGVEENLNDVGKSLLWGLIDKEEKEFMKAEMGSSGTQEYDKLKEDKGCDCKENMAASSVDLTNEFLVDQEMKCETLLESEKGRLLAAVELGELFKDKTHVEKVTGFLSFPQIDEKRSDLEDVQKTVQNDGETIDGIKLIDGSVRPSVKIEVIDDTALIESILVPKKRNDCSKDARMLGTAKMMQRNQQEEEKQEVDGKKAKRPRKKAKDMKMFPEMSASLKNLKHIVEDKDGGLSNGEHAKCKYSRDEMEALRFVNIVEQRKLWRDIHTRLGTAVVKDYNNLASSKHQKQILMKSDPQLSFSRKSEAPGIIRQEYSEHMENKAEYAGDYVAENLNTGDSACIHGTEGEDNLLLEGECSEDYDSDEDYASIQRPAFLVEGEPNFDSGPPEDGLEYLRRVRWEASHIPKVKVAKPSRQKFNEEQTVYMPQIPDIAKCPEHLLPLKHWEDQFLADFLELRLVLSGHDYSSAQLAGKLQSMLINDKENELKTNEVHYDGFGLDHSSKSNTKDDEISASHQSPKMFLSDDSANNYPTLSAILRMDPVARVSMLRKRISSVETLNTLPRSDCLWLFALCAAVDAPLDADTCAALRSLLRKCASLRAAKSEVDDDLVMLNILATISGKYFGQSER